MGNDGAKFCQTDSQSRGLLKGFIIYVVCHIRREPGAVVRVVSPSHLIAGSKQSLCIRRRKAYFGLSLPKHYSFGSLRHLVYLFVCHTGFGTPQLDMLLDQYGHILTSSILPAVHVVMSIWTVGALFLLGY